MESLVDYVERASSGETPGRGSRCEIESDEVAPDEYEAFGSFVHTHLNQNANKLGHTLNHVEHEEHDADVHHEALSTVIHGGSPVHRGRTADRAEDDEWHLDHRICYAEHEDAVLSVLRRCT